jgi:lipid II isoglutaminyl synthase (glutamine-hydrolysing)
MPLFVTLLLTKIVLRLLRLSGRGGGSALPGLIAEKLDPHIITKLTKELPDGVIIVTGTNGKTTTAKMLVAMLSQSGKKVLSNRSGSNLTRGIASALVEHGSWTGRSDFDVAVLEVDEATMPAVCRLTEPSAILVLNLFRDQLDRYGELDKTAEMVGRGISLTMADVYLNSDDPLVASLAKYVNAPGQVFYFGIDDAPERRLAHDWAADSNHCPKCGLALIYSRAFFSHIGHYECQNKDFRRPEPQYVLKSMANEGGGTRLNIATTKGKLNFKLQLPGLYNAYNALAAAAVADGAGMASVQITKAIEGVVAAFGRVEKLDLSGRPAYMLLIKNPTGFNQVIQTFFTDSEKATRRNVLIAINDNFADGRDVSWLWDVAFEDAKLGTITVSGIRAADMALRLKYAGIKCEVEPDLERAVQRLVRQTPAGETCYILPTYTAMLAIRQKVAVEAKLEGFWK